MARTSRMLWWLFALFIVYGATIPFHLTTDRAFIARKWSRVSLDPLVSVESGRHLSIPDVVQNILFFVPFGVFGLLAGARRKGFGVPRILLVTGLAAGLSATIEGLQLFTLDRVTSMTDVMTNTAGALIGAVAAQLVGNASTRAITRLVRAGAVDGTSFYPFMVATIVLCVGSWEPFDVTLDYGTLVWKAKALHRDIWQFGTLTDEGVASLRYALFAVATCAWLDAMGMPLAAFLGAGVGVAAAMGLEASQIAFSSRQPGLEDACTAAASAIAGVVLWTVGRRRRGEGPARAWLVPIVAATAAGAAIQMLSPFTPSSTYQFVGWLPFFGYYQNTTFNTLSHVFELLLIYFPMGFCFARVSTGGARVALAVALVTFAIAAPVEYFQGWIVGRYPDVTDVAFSVVGGLMGVWAGGRGAVLFTKTVGSRGQPAAPGERWRPR